MTPGMIEWAYVLVQMISRKTRRRDWKLNSADCETISPSLERYSCRPGFLIYHLDSSLLLLPPWPRFIASSLFLIQRKSHNTETPSNHQQKQQKSTWIHQAEGKLEICPPCSPEVLPALTAFAPPAEQPGPTRRFALRQFPVNPVRAMYRVL